MKEFESGERKRIKAEYEGLLRQTRREIENLVRQIKEQQASHEAVVAAKAFVETKMSRRSSVQGRKPGPESMGHGSSPGSRSGESEVHTLAVGDAVLSRTFNRLGTLVELTGDQAVVAFGNVRMKLKGSDLRIVRPPSPRARTGDRTALEEFDPRLNVRGMTQEECRESLERFLDRATAAGRAISRSCTGRGLVSCVS